MGREFEWRGARLALVLATIALLALAASTSSLAAPQADTKFEKKLRQAADDIDRNVSDLSSLLGAAGVDTSTIQERGARLSASARKAEKLLRQFRKAKKQFGTVQELLLAKAIRTA